jgi:hypothetical protein
MFDMGKRRLSVLVGQHVRTAETASRSFDPAILFSNIQVKGWQRFIMSSTWETVDAPTSAHSTFWVPLFFEVAWRPLCGCTAFLVS